MQYFYALMWFAIGLILIFSISKENKVFYFAGGFFLFLGAWWLGDALFPEMLLFEGTWGFILKGVTAVALLILVIVFIKEYRKKGAGEQKELPPGDGPEKKD